MISLAAFRLLEFDQKCDTLIRDGNFLACRCLGECRVYLYSTAYFFAEVFYSMKYKRVLLINAFDQSTGLEPYLDMISLADLYSSPMS
jgi:hypothetical protein